MPEFTDFELKEVENSNIILHHNSMNLSSLTEVKNVIENVLHLDQSVSHKSK